MNQNSRRRPRLMVIPGGLPPLPDECFCGSTAVFIDAERQPSGLLGFFASCACCGAEGDRRRNYDEAVKAWNEGPENDRV